MGVEGLYPPQFQGTLITTIDIALLRDLLSTQSKHLLCNEIGSLEPHFSERRPRNFFPRDRQAFVIALQSTYKEQLLLIFGNTTVILPLKGLGMQVSIKFLVSFKPREGVGQVSSGNCQMTVIFLYLHQILSQDPILAKNRIKPIWYHFRELRGESLRKTFKE